MEFDWSLFLGIAIIGPLLGGNMCAILEKKVTGKVRHDLGFKKKRTISSLISIAVGYILAFQITWRRFIC